MLNKAIIDLSAIRSNALSIKKLLPSKTKFCAVVKADAYGHGASKVANALYGLVDCFSVALIEEAVALRYSAIDKDILILNKALNANDVYLAAKQDLILTVTSENDLIEYNRIAAKLHTVIRVHLKYNTGMNRHGITGLAELRRILAIAKSCRFISIDGIYTHFALPENDLFRKKASNEFLLANNLVKRYNNRAIAHASASGGVIKGEFFDMVRVGIMLYGYTPFPSEKITLSPAMRVYAPVTGERVLKSGESALYGFKPSNGKQRVTIVRYGYADGLSRAETEELFNNRCMDVSAYVNLPKGIKMVNVLADAEALAARCGTSVYEVLTKAALRAEKIYLS